MFRKITLFIILAGLLPVVAGCGGGGGSSIPAPPATATPTPMRFTAKVVGNYPINLSYQVTTSSGDIVEMNVASIDVNENCSLKVHCTWTVISRKSEQVIKLSDKGTETFYIVDNTGKIYNHTKGEGAAYTEAYLSTTPVTGAYDFPALNNGVSSIYFYDSIYSRQTGFISVYNSN